MGIFDRFPYSSTHEMNLDFMLGKATEIAEDMQTVATGMAQVQAGLTAISEKTEQATQAAAQAAQSASSIEGSVTAAEEAAEEAQMHNESAQTWANNAMTYKADCQRSATEAAASSASAAQAATAAAASEDTVAQYAQAANASAQSAANNNDSAHQYANQASASASNATFHSSNAQTAATNAQTAATNANTSATNASASADRAASLKTDVETLHRMCTAAVDQAATEAVNAANSAAQAAATKTDVENIVIDLSGKNPSARIVSNSVAPSTVPSINLLNPDDPDYAPGKFIVGTTGVIGDNASYNTTGFIPVAEGQKIAFTVYYNSTDASRGNRRDMRAVAAYDSSKNIISSAGVNADTKIYTVPAGVSFIRFSASNRAWDDYTYYMVWNCNSDDNEYAIVDYQPYGNVYMEGELSISSFPRYLKYGLKISFTAKIDSFGSNDHIYIGWIDGTNMYQGYWEITSTSIILHVGTSTTLTTLTHGLTFSDYISCVITVHSDLPNFSVVLNTKDGTYSAEQTGETTRTLLCGIPTLKTNTTLSNVVLSVSTSQAKNKVWVFGDSYMGYGSDRLLGNLFAWGFTENILVDALGGLDSTGAYQELNRLLVYGTPSVIVWMLGMNDNAEDLPVYNTLVTYCEENNITLILNKCPVVPSRITENTAQNAAVIATGKRYVDSYDAVGCDGEGGWYSGMLSNDNIHPSQTGSMAIASRMLIDAPEIAPN